ncbi:MAG: integration host factor subunit beta [Planctomycetes bacterium]|nr:integration host factor subunit beta [Planctomycetota bacterium]
MVTITKKELVNRIADRTGQTKVVTKEIIQMFLDEIIRELSQDNRLEFRDFGVFEVKSRKARRAQNPRTLEKVHVPPKKVVKFKVGRVMRERVGIGDAPPATRRGTGTDPGRFGGSAPDLPDDLA